MSCASYAQLLKTLCLEVKADTETEDRVIVSILTAQVFGADDKIARLRAETHEAGEPEIQAAAKIDRASDRPTDAGTDQAVTDHRRRLVKRRRTQAPGHIEGDSRVGRDIVAYSRREEDHSAGLGCATWR